MRVSLPTGTAVVLDCGMLGRAGVVRWQTGGVLGLCFDNELDERDISASRPTSSSSDRVSPRAHRCGAEGSMGLSCGEMALNVESVVGGGVSGKKSLGRVWTLEALHLVFSSPCWLM